MRKNAVTGFVCVTALILAARADCADLDSVRALEASGRIYEARRALAQLARDSTDLAILKHQAEITDLYGGAAASAAKRYAEALAAGGAAKAELLGVLERGRIVAAREAEPAIEEWFVDRISALKNPGSLAPSSAPRAEPQKVAGAWIPGGVEALGFMVGAQPGIGPERFLVDYCRRIVARSPQELLLLQKSVTGYFEDLRQLIAVSVRNGNHATLTLSLEGKQGPAQTGHVLDLLGWKLVRTKQKILVQSSEGKSHAAAQELASALAIDQTGMQSAFQKGKPFTVEIAFDFVPILFDEATWQAPMKTDRLTGGFAEALVRNPDFARAYLGLSSVDRPTASVLLSAFGLSSRYAAPMAEYSSALAVAGGRAIVPGGVAAEGFWSKLAGVSPADPARFFRALFDRDQGRLLTWFFQLSELDAPHQRFFVSSQHRIDAFYEAFSQSDDARTGSGKLTRGNSFFDFLRSIPLEENQVRFPGSPEVWKFAGAHPITAEQTDKLIRRIHKNATEEVEDEILLRLARTHDKDENGGNSETIAFLAVARLDEHRADPLDERSALMLAQNYNEYGSLFPYLSEFTELEGKDFESFFAFLAKMKSADENEAETALGQFEALIEIVRLGMTRGTLSEARATEVFRKACAAFTAAQERSGYGMAALDSLREAMGGDKDADRAVSRLVLGDAAPVEIETGEATFSIDLAHRRDVAYGRVLSLQKIPAVSLLLNMDMSARLLAGGRGDAKALADALARDADALPVAEIPKTVKFEGRAKRAMQAASPERLRHLTAELRQAAAKKKVNPKDLEKGAREILEALAPEVRLGLTGVVYAAYLDPGDILAANDPLLARKHQSFDLSPSSSRHSRFPSSGLEDPRGGEGSYFMGGFAGFALAAAGANSGAKAEASSALFADQLASIRMTPWGRYSDALQVSLGLRLRLAREWCAWAAFDAAAFDALAEDTLGLLSLTRRRQLLNAVSAKQWNGIRDNLTLTDMLSLSDRYLARYSASSSSPLGHSALDAAVRRAGETDLGFLGPLPARLYGCAHPHLVPLAPYEEYEHHLFPFEAAERTAEIKVYLADALDRAGLPASALPAIAEPLARQAFGAMRMSDERDWASALRAFRSIDDRALLKALEAAQ